MYTHIKIPMFIHVYLIFGPWKPGEKPLATLRSPCEATGRVALVVVVPDELTEWHLEGGKSWVLSDGLVKDSHK